MTENDKLRALAAKWRAENGDYPESKKDCADELEAALAALGGKGEASDIIREFIQCADSGRPPGKLLAQARDYLAANPTQPEAQGVAVAWHILHEDGGSHVMLAESVDERFRDALAANGRNLRPLIYGDTTAPKSPVEAKGVAVAWGDATTALQMAYEAGAKREGYTSAVDWLHDRALPYTAAPKVAEGVEAVELTVCCGREECGGECGNEWRGTHWVRKAAPKPVEGVTDAMVEAAIDAYREAENEAPHFADSPPLDKLIRAALAAAQQQEADRG